MKLLRWFSDRFRDLFFGPGNLAADLGRIISFLATFAMLASTVWNMMLGLPIELDKAGVGYAAVLGACAAFIYAKDRAKAEHVVAKALADCPPETLPAPTKAKPVATKPKPVTKPKSVTKPKPVAKRQHRYAHKEI